MSHEFVPSKKMIQSAVIDACRKESVREFGLAARPERSIRQAKKFSWFREQQWKAELAVEMVWFARSQDVVEGWPYERFASRLEAKGVVLPDKMSIEAAVREVDRSLAELDPKFHVNNIELPMSRRASSVLVGAPSLSIDQNEAESGSWVRARVYDQREQSLVELHRTSVCAAKSLRERAKLFWLEVGRLTAKGTQRAQETAAYEVAVFEATATLFERMARAHDYEEFDTLIRLCEPVTDDSEMPDLPLATLMANQSKPRWKHTKGWDQFARDIAWEVHRVLAVVDAKK